MLRFIYSPVQLVARMSTSGFNLDADDYDISEVLEGSHQTEVPNYQREYAWGEGPMERAL